MHRGILPFCLATTLVLSACAGAVSDLLPDSPGADLPAKVESEQALDLAQAGSALPSDHAATAKELGSLQFNTGYARVWGTATDFVTMIALGFPSASSAAALVDFERRDLGGAQNAFITSHKDIPGSYVFAISSTTPSSGSQNAEICNGVWFAYRAYALESLACGTTPSWATQIEEAAKGLYERARARLG
jgi:hypothetical protein